MNTLTQKNIILAVTGGIAAYKSAYLARELKKMGANLRVVMTKSACQFITPLTFQALTGNPVSTDLLDDAAEAAMGHIELSKWADLLLIAPASANTLAKVAHGLADDLLTTLCLATQAPIYVAPAMNQQMWHARPTQANMATLRDYGIHVLGPDSGEQACGDIGLGRMLEPEDIIQQLATLEATSSLPRFKKRILITAGPTREALDPVRFITNHSSGKMGIALAQILLSLGADVTLVSGPMQAALPKHVRFKCIAVDSADEMAEAVHAVVEEVDVFISVAAVADYAPLEVAKQKIKKQDDRIVLHLKKNRDILREVAALKNRPFCVGFAAESENLIENAVAKLEAKQLDMICVNSITNPGVGFNSDNNEIVVLTKTKQVKIDLASKQAVALRICQSVIENYNEKYTTEDIR